MSATRQVFVRFGLIGLGFLLVSALTFDWSAEHSLAGALFGVSGLLDFALSTLMIGPICFALTGFAALWFRRQCAFMLVISPPQQRADLLFKLTETERRFPWFPSVFFLFGIDHNGNLLR